MNSINEVVSVYGMLEDDISKDIYINRLNWIITGNYQYIRNMVERNAPDLVPWREYELPAPLLLRALPKDRNFVLYGAGAVGKRVMEAVKGDARFVGFCSDTKWKQEQGFCGFPVMSPEALLSEKSLSVIVSTVKSENEILRILKQGGYPQEFIFCISDILLGGEDSGKYFDVDFFTYGDEEVMVDAGCYDLDDAVNFRKHCRSVKKVYAFEPDPINYGVCVRRKEALNFKEAEIYPYGVWSKKARLSFSSSGDEDSHFDCQSMGNPHCVEVVSIDETVSPEERVTMIKMDVEGAELEALKGASQTIVKNKPKLAICIYHKPEDMIELPLYIKKLVPEYRLYIRHHSSSEFETVLYAVI